MDEVPELSVVGASQMELAWHASYGLVRLTLLSDSMRIGPSKPFLRFLGVRRWESPYSELTEVQPINAGRGLRTGIRFRRRGSVDWIIFYLRAPALSEVLRILTSHGVHVSANEDKGFLLPGA